VPLHPSLDVSFELDAFQAKAIDHLDANESVLVCAPTGTGKTLIADHLVACALERGEQVIYTAPVKALSNQKYRDWIKVHGEENVGLITGDLVIRRDAPCRVMTTEILRNMLLTGEEIPNLKQVILDEIHFLDDRERGTTWEEVLIYLDPSVQVLGLSATLSNVQEFAHWLSDVRGRKTAVIIEEQRAVPLELMLFNRETGLTDIDNFEVAQKRWRRNQANLEASLHQQGHRGGRGRGRGRGKGGPSGGRGKGRGRGQGRGRDRQSPRTRHLDVFQRLRDEHLPYLYFVFSRHQTEQFARNLHRKGHALLEGDALRKSRAALDDFERRSSDGVLTHDLRKMYESGIGFHHAGLHVQLKGLVEHLYEKRLLKVLYCTSTFALGINMPARTVVLDGLKKFDGRDFNPLTVRQFLQKAGRAGRRGMDDVGYVVVRMDHDDFGEFQHHVRRYATGESEKVRSSFGLSFNSVVNLLARHDRDRIQELISRSFLSFHLEQRASSLEQRALSLEGSLRITLNTESKLLPPAHTMPQSLRSQARRARKWRNQASKRRNRVWDDFEERVCFLTDIGYLNHDGTFREGGEVVQKLQISEIFVTELYLEGILDHLPPTRLFGLLCALVQNLPRGAQPVRKLRGEARALAKRVNRIRYGDVVSRAIQLSRQEVDWCPDLIPFGEMWANGNSLNEIMEELVSRTDISGDMVGGFRRARDLAGQLAEVWKESNPERSQQIRTLVRATGRDEVEVIG